MWGVMTLPQSHPLQNELEASLALSCSPRLHPDISCRALSLTLLTKCSTSPHPAHGMLFSVKPQQRTPVALRLFTHHTFTPLHAHGSTDAGSDCPMKKR
jgi:hypothetical protein